jgi:hypothetical protein
MFAVPPIEAFAALGQLNVMIEESFGTEQLLLPLYKLDIFLSNLSMHVKNPNRLK